MFMACPIVDISVKPFESKEEVTWYPLRVKFHTNQTHELAYQYMEFVHYSKSLHQQFECLKKHQLSKLHSHPKAQRDTERQLEIEDFCRQLLLLPIEIQCADTFINFFLQKQELKPPTLLKRSFSIHGKKKKDSPMVKFKVILDINNMIVMRVPRSITLHQLKAKVIQKFSLLDIKLTEACILRVIYNYKRHSILSTSSCSSSEEYDPVSQHVVENEKQFSKILQETSQKVILKCIPS